MAENIDYEAELAPKLDLWVEKGLKRPESNNTANRGYSLFRDAIGFTFNEPPTPNQKYTVLVSQFQQQDMPIEVTARIEMIVELKNEIIDLRKVKGKGYF